jgi:hypothetical protein
VKRVRQEVDEAGGKAEHVEDITDAVTVMLTCENTSKPNIERAYQTLRE